MRLFSKNFSLISLLGVLESKDFNYHETEEWGEHAPACDGDSQSPIDIPDIDDLETFESEKIDFLGYETSPETMTLVNDGHSMKVSLTWPSDASLPYVTGGPLGNDKYVIEQFHFHWGADDNSGSEHTYDGKSGALEVHFVHYNDKYGSFSDALKYDDGLAVLGGLYYSDQYTSDGIEKIWKNLDKPLKDGEKRDIKPFPLKYFEPISEAMNYITYPGSLTTPPCLEIVTWIVATDKFSITSEQLDELRKNVELHDGDDHNNRPIQPLNGRQVQFVRID